MYGRLIDYHQQVPVVSVGDEDMFVIDGPGAGPRQTQCTTCRPPARVGYTQALMLLRAARGIQGRARLQPMRCEAVRVK